MRLKEKRARRSDRRREARAQLSATLKEAIECGDEIQQEGEARVKAGAAGVVEAEPSLAQAQEVNALARSAGTRCPTRPANAAWIYPVQSAAPPWFGSRRHSPMGAMCIEES
jgi:hypothetical protein